MAIKVKYSLLQMYIVGGKVAVSRRHYFKAETYGSALEKVAKKNGNFYKKMSGGGYIAWQISWNLDLFEESKFQGSIATNFY